MTGVGVSSIWIISRDVWAMAWRRADLPVQELPAIRSFSLVIARPSGVNGGLEGIDIFGMMNFGEGG